jgi:quercetin dioxygenase-like cupin family protein
MSITIRAGERRRVETPNATMTTLASPTLGPSAGLSLWTVEMEAGARGPVHVFDTEQLWTVLDGRVTVLADGASIELAPQDTIVIPARVERQISATTAARLVVCGHGSAVAGVVGEQAPRGTPAWIS